MRPSVAAGLTLAIGFSQALAGCADEQVPAVEQRLPIVYGLDGRTDYFETADPAARARMAESTVALIANGALDRAAGRIVPGAPSWGEVAGLCAGEPFAEQPAVAFCTGVLVDWDLVLTAGHCVRVFGLQDFSIAFGYYYPEPGQLALAADDIIAPAEIVSEALTDGGDGSRLDYAWLRLSRPAAPPRQPAPLHTQPPSLAAGDRIITIGAASGVPLKSDAGGVVRDARQRADYFVANTDTSGGWSGGGAFDQQLVLAGILSRGGPDLQETADGCQATQHAADAAGGEEFTYLHRAVEDLCADDPSRSSICRPDCEQPCRALPPPPAVPDGGCAAGGTRPSPGLAVILASLALRTTRRGCGRRRGRR